MLKKYYQCLVYDDMDTETESKKTLSPMVSELFIGMKINISMGLISLFLYLNHGPG